MLLDAGKPEQAVRGFSEKTFSLSFAKSSSFPAKSTRGFGVGLFEDALDGALSLPHRISVTRERLTVWVKTHEGVYAFWTSAKRLFSTTTRLFFLWSLGSTIVLLGIALLFMKNQVRPIYRLSRWVDGIDVDIPPEITRIEGAREIRIVAKAVQLMAQRLRRHYEERRNMLLGISHDLRTPLTRLKLQLQVMPPSQDREELKRDVDLLIAMTREYLSFGSLEAREEAVIVPLRSWLNETIARCDHSGEDILLTIDIDVPQRLRVTIFPIQLARCLQNLLGNSFRYAKSEVRVRACVSGRHWHVFIEDDGPGIPVAQREDVFKPFFKADPGRHIEGHNVGLGLSVAKSVILAHEGRIIVGNSSLGGALFSLDFPVKAHDEVGPHSES